MSEQFAVVGLGYVGLPVALALGRRHPGTKGFDIDAARVAGLQRGEDWTGDVDGDEMSVSGVAYTANPEDLAGSTFFVVAVPTPIDSHRRPDLTALVQASETVGRFLKPGGIVVYESTVYPGVTEEVCGPVLERTSGLRCGVDFKLGYSPERINPGDREHRLENTTKVVSGQDAEALARIVAAYESIVDAQVYQAPNIRVAEAAKVIENTQRDLNVALMNELAIIFDRVGLRTKDVLDAAGTKWNFLRFEPGLVGGHCIGVDPYYLTALAERTGYHPEVILAGRRINEGMGRFIAQRLVKTLVNNDVPVRRARVAILGITFKPDVKDLRNTKVVDIVHELRDFGIHAQVHDPTADAADVKRTYGLDLCAWDSLRELDAIVLAVPHAGYLAMGLERLLQPLVPKGIFFDIKAAFRPEELPASLQTWSL